MSTQTANSQTYSVETIAKLLQVTPRRVQQLSKEGYIPKSSRGKYELIGSVQGYIRFLKSQINDEDDDENVDGSGRHKSRLLKARADKAEIELAEIRGDIVRIDAVADIISREYSDVRTSLQSVASRCASRLVGEENHAVITSVIDAEIAAALKGLRYDGASEDTD